MAARRLIIVMIVLLAISTVVAIIAPQPAQRRGAETETTPTVAAPEGAGWRDRADRTPLEKVVYSDAGSPKSIAVRVGDRLRLEVRGSEGREISIPGLGLTATQSRSAPASFEIYFDAAGDFEVLDAKTGERLSRIVVRERQDDGPALKAAEPGRPDA